MITHKIDKYPDQTTNPVYYPIRKTSFEMGKIEYANHLRMLPYRKGDLVAFHTCPPPYDKWMVYQVVDIQEMHRMVEFSNEQVGPKCLYLMNFGGTRLPYLGGTKEYKKIAYWEIPAEWKPMMGKLDYVDV